METRDLISAFPVADYCRKNHIKKMSFFGSILRADFSEESDVDILVEFEPGFIPGLRFFSIQDELSRLLGRKVDLQTPGFLGDRIYRTVRKEAVSVYEQA